MKRRDFLRISLLGGAAATVFPIDLSAKGAGKSGFTLWQIPSQVDTIGNSYVFQTDRGRLIVMDGGMNEEAPFLSGFLSALGCEVEAWFISHPHNDHMGALTEILKKPGDLKIKKIYHSRFSESLIDREEPYNIYAREFYAEIDKLNPSITEVIDLKEPGLELKIDGLNLKILGVTNEELAYTNPYNNSSMIIRVWDKAKSIVFLGDAGIECGDKVLNSAFRNDLDCDYLQMAHHGIKPLNSEPAYGRHRHGYGTTMPEAESIRNTSRHSTPAAGWTKSALPNTTSAALTDFIVWINRSNTYTL